MLSVFVSSAVSYSMESLSNGKQEVEDFDNDASLDFLPAEVVTIIVAHLIDQHDNLTAAYNGVVNFLTTNKEYADWLNDADFRKRLVDTLYKKFMPVKPNDNALAAAIKFVFSIKNPAHQKAAYSKLIEWFNVPLESKILFFQEKLKEAIKAGNQAKAKDLVALINYVGQLTNKSYQTLNTPDTEGNMALHYASLYEQYDVIESLLKAGADVNAKNKNGETPLHMVTDEAIVNLLMQYGADPYSANNKGVTPLEEARNLNYTNLVKSMEEALAARKNR